MNPDWFSLFNGPSSASFAIAIMDCLVVIFVALLGVVCGQTTEVSQCIEHSGPLPINTYIAGCTVQPCVLTQLENAVINIIFQAPHTMRSMRTRAVAYLPFLPAYNHDLGDDAITCNFLDNSYCPVLQGEVLQYTLNMFIESYFFTFVRPTVEFLVEDEDGTIIMCIRVALTIREPNPRAGNSTMGNTSGAVAKGTE